MKLKKGKYRLILLILVIIIGIYIYNTYSERMLIEEIEFLDKKDKLVVYKMDIDKNHNFLDYVSKTTKEKEKEEVVNYIAKRKLKRIIPLIEGYFDSQFDTSRIVPQYRFVGYMINFEILSNKYVRIYKKNKSIYYKFIKEINLEEFEKMMDFEKLEE